MSETQKFEFWSPCFILCPSDQGHHGTSGKKQPYEAFIATLFPNNRMLCPTRLVWKLIQEPGNLDAGTLASGGTWRKASPHSFLRKQRPFGCGVYPARVYSFFTETAKVQASQRRGSIDREGASRLQIRIIPIRPISQTHFAARLGMNPGGSV